MRTSFIVIQVANTGVQSRQ